MTSADVELKEIAISEGNDLQGHIPELERELLELQAQEKELQASIISTPLAVVRSRNFVPVVGGDYQCPLCWVESERKSGLTHVDNPGGDDYFACSECDSNYFLGWTSPFPPIF